MLAVVAIVGAVLALEAVSRASPVMVLGVAVLGVVSLIWLLSFAASARRPRAGMSASDRARWMIVPVLVAGTLGLVWLDLPFLVRLQLSRPAMDEAAAEIVIDGGTDRAWIGLWPVTSVEVMDGGMSFLIDGSGFMSRVGLTYSPVGRPPDPDGGVEFVDLGGGWWRWTEWF